MLKKHELKCVSHLFPASNEEIFTYRVMIGKFIYIGAVAKEPDGSIWVPGWLYFTGSVGETLTGSTVPFFRDVSRERKRK